MNSYFTSRTAKLAVVNLSNSLAITRNSRLDFGYSESQPTLSRLIQTFLNKKGDFKAALLSYFYLPILSVKNKTRFIVVFIYGYIDFIETQS